MEVTKVIAIDQNALGFEVGENPKWRGEFTLEQIAQFEIREGREVTVHLLEMEDVFANVEFGGSERTTVPITKVSQNENFSTESPSEMEDTLISRKPENGP